MAGAAPPLSGWTRLVLVVGMLVSGTMNTLSKRFQNKSSALGDTGESHEFKKPWFQTLIMFMGEALCLLAFAVSVVLERRARAAAAKSGLDDADSQPLLEGSAAQTAPVKTSPALLLIPTCLDLLGTSFGGIGLIYTYPSVWQMLRGSIILFTAALSKIFLGRKLFRYHYVGLAIVTAGLATVGTSSLLDETGSQKSLALGIFFIVLGQFCNAVQMVFEEKFLKSRNLAPLFVVGMEGVWGVLIMACGVLPVMQHVHGSDKGSYENASDALRMISQNHSLLAYCLIYLASIAFYNFFGLSVAKSLTSVHRSLIDALRTILVWSVSLFIYYVISERLGEPWNRYSPLQLAGFAMLVTGTLAYNHILRFAALEPPSEEAVAQQPPQSRVADEYRPLRNPTRSQSP